MVSKLITFLKTPQGRRDVVLIFSGVQAVYQIAHKVGLI